MFLVHDERNKKDILYYLNNVWKDAKSYMYVDIHYVQLPHEMIICFYENKTNSSNINANTSEQFCMY